MASLRGGSMTELLSWHDEWCIGIDWVDADHHEMAMRINRLSDAVNAALDDDRDGEAKSLVLRRMDELIKHIRAHFAVEEDFLRRIAYPAYEGHCRAHYMEVAELIDLRRALAGDSADELDLEMLADIKRWFFNHVIAEDRAYADYYRSLPQDSAPE